MSLEELNRRKPRVGEHWQSVNDNIFVIDAVAKHVQTNKDMVVYHNIRDTPGDGFFNVWVAPMEYFMAPINHKKYPHSKEKYMYKRV